VGFVYVALTPALRLLNWLLHASWQSDVYQLRRHSLQYNCSCGELCH